MDTKQAAALVGTTPRVFRSFLRSPISTFVAVGSGSRYEFGEDEIPMLKKRFLEWQTKGKSTTGSSRSSAPATAPVPRRKPHQPSKRDQEVWAEEGEVVIEDIRNPRIRARVLADADAAEDRLMMLLMARGMHVSQRATNPSVNSRK